MGTEIGTESPAPFAGGAGGATVGAAAVFAPLTPPPMASDGRGADGRLPLDEINESPGVGPLPVPSRGCESDEDEAEDDSEGEEKSPPRTVR